MSPNLNDEKEPSRERCGEIGVPGKGDSKCKGPEAEPRFWCSRLSSEASSVVIRG